MTAIETLYNGNIRPCDLKELTKRDDYNAALKQVGSLREKLEDSI